MINPNEAIAKQFSGYAATPFLWKGALNGLDMYAPELQQQKAQFQGLDAPNSRLGKRVEEFVLWELQNEVGVRVLRENVQVFDGQTTIGELDCLLLKGQQAIHLEMVYKFYLYDPSLGIGLDRWIGPNRNDSLVQKLSKLKERQLPLLYKQPTQPVLQECGLVAENILQQVFFKAQLFLPLSVDPAEIELVNKDCVRGVYFNKSELKAFRDNQFYVPGKLNWLSEPHKDVPWIDFASFHLELDQHLEKKKSPLCWMRYPNGDLEVCFVVWWG